LKNIFVLFVLFVFTVAVNAQTKIVNYKVKSGDTLYTVAHKHKTTIVEVQKLNGLKTGDVLKSGRVVRVPTNTYFPKKKALKKQTKRKKTNSLKTALGQQGLPFQHVKKRRRVAKVDNVYFKSSKHNMSFGGFGFGFGTKKSKNIIKLAKQKLGQKYVWGAIGKSGTFDCSGFTNYVFKKNGINIPRTSRNQAKFGKLVARNKLKKGDLIFFDTSSPRKGYVNHVGIYLGHGRFIHASSAKKKVTISTLSNFYAKRYKCARRPS